MLLTTECIYIPCLLFAEHDYVQNMNLLAKSEDFLFEKIQCVSIWVMERKGKDGFIVRHHLMFSRQFPPWCFFTHIFLSHLAPRGLFILQPIRRTIY